MLSSGSNEYRGSRLKPEIKKGSNYGGPNFTQRCGYNDRMPHTVTRRRAGALLVAAPLAAGAQAPPAPNQAAADADLEDARQQARNNYQSTQRVKLAMTVEPAVTFKA